MRATPSTSPFVGAAALDQRQRRRQHADRAAGARDAVRLALGRDVDHVGLAAARRSGVSGLAGRQGRSSTKQRGNDSVASYEAKARPRRAPAALGSDAPPCLFPRLDLADGAAAPAARASSRSCCALALLCRPGSWPPAAAQNTAARARRHRLGRASRIGTERKLGDEIMRADPRRSGLHRRPAAARIPAVASGSRSSPRRARSATSPPTSTSASPGSRSWCATERQRVRAAGRLRRRAPRPDRDDGDARRARLGARARDVARHAAPHRAQHLGRLEALAGRPRGAGPRHARGVAQQQPRRDERGHRRHARRRRSRASSTSRATSSARPIASASR